MASGPIKPLKKKSKIKKIKPVKPLKKRKKRPPRTAKTVGTSMAEKEFKLYLNSIGIQVDEQHKIQYKFYDFIIKGSNVLLEFQGDYWHCNPKVYPTGPINKIQKRTIINDEYKRKLAKMNGFEIVYVWEKEFNEDKEALRERLKKYVNSKEVHLDNIRDYINSLVKKSKII